MLSKYSNTSRSEVIDFLRGFAILLVIFHHLPVHGWFVENISYLFTATYTGVHLFFILSGYVLFNSFTDKKKALNKEEIRKFYLKRFFRLYPLFIINCLASWLFFSKGDVKILISSLKALSTLSVFYGNEPFPYVNYVAWSLEVEIWLSLLVPVLLWLILKTSLNLIIWVVFISSLTARIITQFIPVYPVHLIVFENLDSFTAGIWLCGAFKDCKLPLKKFYTFLPVYITAAVFALSVFLYYQSFSLSYYKPFAQLVVITGYLFLIKNVSEKYKLWKVRRYDKLLRVAGAGCFSLYMWHSLLADYLLNEESMIKNYLIFFAFLIIISALSYFIVEKGMYSYLVRRYLRKS